MLTVLLNGEYHEEIAIGDEERYFICYVRNEDIDELDEINGILEDWLIKNLP